MGHAERRRRIKKSMQHVENKRRSGVFEGWA
jgi:hypothetical protein